MDSLKIKQIHIYNLPESHNIKNKYLNIIYIMDKIKENDKIKHLNRLAELSKGIIAKIQAMPDLNDLKLDLDVILYVCNLIENNIKQNETKIIDKKKIVVDIIQ